MTTIYVIEFKQQIKNLRWIGSTNFFSYNEAKEFAERMLNVFQNETTYEILEFTQK
jgi:hypothetical protein